MSDYYLERGDYRLLINPQITPHGVKYCWRVRFRGNTYDRESGSGATLFDAWQKGIKALDNAVKSAKVEVGS